ncbi:MAG: hypothetical protein EOO90_20150 [Pedobacter sp.]|nr:MAG: hypothetical protein EOO90_20150 [Pedobacter sp.]
METITKEKLDNKEKLTTEIASFFDSRKISEHLIFLDCWMEKMLININHEEYTSASDLLFFSEKFLDLLSACRNFEESSSIEKIYFEESVKIPKSFINIEQKGLLTYPYHLNEQEICNPLLIFGDLFNHHTLEYYEATLQRWLFSGLSSDIEPENIQIIFPIYKSLRKLVSACWLVHERAISKNSYRSHPLNIVQPNFSLSCPLLLKDEELAEPYLMVESFFSFASLDEYRQDLNLWFKSALTEDVCFENANDLLFIHNQFTQLLHAGYLISSSQLEYSPRSDYSSNFDTFGEWLLAKKNNHSIQTLSLHFRKNPLLFLSENLTIEKVRKIRIGLKEWLEAGLSRNTTINTLDQPYIFEQYEDLQSLMEALFILITEPNVIK